VEIKDGTVSIKPKLNAYFKPFLEHKRYKGLRGGRGSGKTTEVAQQFVILAWVQKARFLCCREIQKSIKQSSYKSIEKAVDKLGLSKDFSFLLDKIVCKSTGSEFLFQGLRTNAEQILSMENIKYVWIEQAESVSHESLKLLTPTIRTDKSEIWATWNPRYPFDAIEALFKNFSSVAVLATVNHSDNHFFPEALELERQICKEKMPEDYAHIWLGAFRQDNIARVLLPYNDLLECVGAADKIDYKPPAYTYMGLDVADGGADKPAYAIRQGSCLLEVKELRDRNGYEIATTIIPLAHQHNMARCHYDVTGVGASIKGEFYRVQKYGSLPFTPEPFLFGGAVRGKDVIYAHGISNGNFFSRANAQGFWNLRLRLDNTKRALRGDTVNLDRCLFLPKYTSEKLLMELSQIEYERDMNDRIKVIKAPKGAKSPNLADAVMMSFSHDLINGLRAI